MEQTGYHPLLQEQLRSVFASSPVPAEFRPFLDTINRGYITLESRIKEAEKATKERTTQLIASTAQAYSFLDTINKGFLMCDTGGEVVLANNLLRSLISPNHPDAYLSVEFMASIFPSDLQLKALIDQCRETREPIERDNVTFGKRILHLYIAPLMSNAGTTELELLGIVILVEDVTEQKMLDRSKDEFLSIASHELRTPLTAIRGNASLLKKYYVNSIEDKDMAQMIDDIHASSVRLIGIVNDFLDVAAIEQGRMKMQPESFQISEVTDEILREFGQLCADKGVELVKDKSVDGIPAVNADRERIKQVIINLVGNAMKFTDKGSITVSAKQEGGLVQIAVADTGRGMSEESQKLLFRKFQQTGESLLTRDTTKGTGLGLYISKLIVEHSGGTIGLVKSAPNQGSEFAFTIPEKNL
jgi:signal transduction histidine kinase